MSQGSVNVPILVGGLGIVGALVAVLASGFGKDPRAIPSMLKGRDAPPFCLTSLDGDEVCLDALDGPVVLNFWSTWCGPCKMEHPVLQRAAQAHPDVRFMGVVYSDDMNKAARYLERAGSTYANYEDPGGRVAIDYGVTGVPETFFINAAGVITHKESAPFTHDAMLAARLAEVRR